MSVYDEIISLSRVYLGPAAKPFIERQCQLHLHIEAPALRKAHLLDLARWVEAASAPLMGEARSKAFADKIVRC